jgi:uncharacterized protein YjcR
MREESVCRIPLGVLDGLAPPADDEARLADAFVAATSAMSSAAAAELIGVRPGTIRKWRRRTPRWIRAATATRLHAWLTGDRSSTVEEGLQRAFRRTLRRASAPD